MAKSIKLEGSIVRFKCKKDDYIIAIIESEDGCEYNVKGNIELPTELYDHISGTFDKYDTIYGETYDASKHGCIKVDHPKYYDAITERFNILMKNAGVRSGKRIHEEIAKIRNTDNVWDTLSYLTTVTASENMIHIAKAFEPYRLRMNSKKDGFNAVVQYLQNFGLNWSESSIKSIFGFKKDCENPVACPITKDILYDDPLILFDIGKLRKSQFVEYMTALYRMNEIDKKSYDMCQLLLAVRETEKEGHTYIPITSDMHIDESNRIFKRFLHIYNNCLYRKDTYEKEYTIAESIASLLKEYGLPVFNRINLLNDIQSLDYDSVNGKKIQPSEEQCMAVFKMLTERIQIILGSAGTGKTTTLRLLIRMFRKFYSSCINSIVLLAPTGKAVNRIRDSISDLYKSTENIQTIHRFAYSVTNYYSNEDRNYIPPFISSGISMIVVDEMSMVDNSSMSLLLNALTLISRHEKIEMPHIVMLGDLSQLGPIGCGFPLESLVKIVPVYELTLVKRQSDDAMLMKVLTSVRSYHVPSIPSGLTDVNLLQINDKTIEPLVIQWLDEHPYYKDNESATIICPTNNLCSIVTKIAREHTNPLKYTDTIVGGKSLSYANSDIWGNVRKGDKVIQIKNNYIEDVYNGTVGRVIKLEFDQKDGEAYQLYAVVEFANKSPRKYSQEEIYEELNLAYALTVHKSQGSEYDNVLFVVENNPTFITGNLMYTAISRGKKHVQIMIKGVESWNQCRNKPRIRRTNLFEMIESHIEYESE